VIWIFGGLTQLRPVSPVLHFWGRQRAGTLGDECMHATIVEKLDCFEVQFCTVDSMELARLEEEESLRLLGDNLQKLGITFLLYSSQLISM